MPDISVNRTTYIKLGNNQPITTGIAEGSMLIDRVLFAQDFIFGQFASSRFEIQIYGINNVAGQNIEVYQMENNARTDLFVGQIESSKLDNAGYYRDIIAYDKFYFIAKKNVADWFNGLWTNNTQISVLDAFKSLLAYFGIDYDQNTVVAANFTGNLYKTSVPSFEKISFKDMVKFLLEPLALIPYINASGNVAVYAPLMANNIDLYPLIGGVRQTRYDTNQSVFEEYEVLSMQWVGIANIDSAILAQEEITGNTSDIRYDLPYNPIRLDLYVEDAETAQEAVLEDFIDKASFDAYTPCEVFMIVSDMSIKLGDKITTTRGTSYVSEMILSGPMLVEQQLISRGSQIQQEVEEEYDPVFAYLDNKVTEATEDLQDQIDNFEPSEAYLEKVNEFSSTVTAGMGLKTIKRIQDGATITYFYAPDANGAITNSKFVFVMKSNGFAWTDKWEGNADASSESHTDPDSGDTIETVWSGGIGSNGSSLLKILNAYKISADIIEGGVLEIKDANGNVVHRFSNIDGSASIGNGGITYDTANGLQINSSVIIGAVEDAVAYLDINSIARQEVAYAISANGTTPPTDGEDSVTETWYFVSNTAQDANAFYTTYSDASTWRTAFRSALLSNKINGVQWYGTNPYLYSFDRTDYDDGTSELSNFQLLATFETGSNSVVLETATFYKPFSSMQSSSTLNNYADADIWVYQLRNNNVRQYVTDVYWTSTDKYLYSFERTVYQDGHGTVNAPLIATYGSGSSSTVLESENWYYAFSFSPPYTAETINANWFTTQAEYHAKEWFNTNWGVDSNNYLHTLNRTVYQNGDSAISNIQLVATYGESYPPIGGGSSWSSTIPDTSSSGGMYLWTRTTTVFTDGTSSEAYTKSYIALDGTPGTPGTPGQNGQDGNDGKGIASTTQYFKASSNATSIPSGGWTPTASSAGFDATNRYLWTYTVTTYTDGTSSGSSANAYVLGVWGQKGDPGDSGSAVQGRGIVSITPQYALSTSNSTAPTLGWTESVPEYPTTTSPTASGTVSSVATILTGLNLQKNTSYTISVNLAENGKIGAYVRVLSANGDQYGFCSIGSTTEASVTFTTGTSDLPNCTVEINPQNVETTYRVTVTGTNLSVKYYYWQRDLITFDKPDSGGNYTQETTGVLAQGFNAAIFAVNRLNPLFAEVYLEGATQVMIDAGHLYANSVTAYSVAAYEAIIKNLMTNYVRVDGDIDVVDGDITVTQAPMTDNTGDMPRSFLDDFCQTHYGKSYSQLEIYFQPLAFAVAATHYIEQKMIDGTVNGKLSVTNAEKTIRAALYPNALILADTTGNEANYGYYGSSATIPGDVFVGGSVVAKNIQKNDITVGLTTLEDDGYVEVNVDFEEEFPSPPVVTLAISGFDKYLVATLGLYTTQGFTAYITNANPNDSPHAACTLNWIAIS